MRYSLAFFSASLFAAVVLLFTPVFILLGRNFSLRFIPATSINVKGTSVIDEAADIPDVEISAWLPWWQEEKAIISINKAKNKLTTIMPIWYQLDEEGKLNETNSKLTSNILRIVQNNQIKVMPSISNAGENGFDGQRVSKILADREAQVRLSSLLVVIATENQYAGWDLDWEEIAEEDRDAYTAFVEDLSQTLSENDLELSVTVHAQMGNSKDWAGVKGQDVQELGKYADYVRVMAYDFHYAGSKPGSITPMYQLEQTLEYVSSIVPFDKLVIGLGTYGYDWTEDGGTALQYDAAMELTKKANAKIVRDANSHSLTSRFAYDGEDHDIWFEDAVSLQRKIELAQEYGISQISLWHLGGEDAKIWD